MKEERRLQSMVEPLCVWYEQNHRVLPWRENPNPYWVWISEIMLQQTRVEAVKSYFLRFINRLPDLNALANVSEEELLKLWEGLGYYSRAKNLKKAAIICIEKYNGQLPSCYEQLLALPGIGSYTAGAIASIAFGQMVPAVDGNVLRVISRILANTDDISNIKTKKFMEQQLKQMMVLEKMQTEYHPGIWNQSLMELGATVCIPNGVPKCEVCPVKNLCLAKQEGRVLEIPVKAPKKQRKVEERTVFVVEYKGQKLIHKRLDKGLLAGLYELPNVESTLTMEEAKQFWEFQIGAEIQQIVSLGKAKHIFTHIQWNMVGYKIVLPMQKQMGEGWIWATPEQLQEQYSLPSAFKAYSNLNCNAEMR